MPKVLEYYIEGEVLKKIVLTAALLIIAISVGFALAPPVQLELNTIIEPFSALTINNTVGTATIVPGTPLPINYTYQGNQLVSLTVSSANGFTLRHSDFTNHATWIINYTMTLDYGSGQTAVTNNQAVPLVDTNGVYNLAKTMVFTATAGTYPAGTYSDTLTFTITAP